MIHSFLLIGQSNAGGRGFAAEVEPLDTRNGRIKVLRNGRWWQMYRPVNPDRVTSGVCLAESFAEAYADEHPDIEVGIIPCADGGTNIEQWLPGEVLFDNAVFCAKLAMRTSSIRGILWHQGESDCNDRRYEQYTERFFTVMNGLRKALGKPSLPILIGGLGDFLTDFISTKTPNSEIPAKYKIVNEILERLGEEYPNCSFVSAKGLGANPDNLHFSAKALREFGLRYYEKYKTLVDNHTFLDDEAILSDSVKTELELL